MLAAHADSGFEAAYSPWPFRFYVLQRETNGAGHQARLMYQSPPFDFQAKGLQEVWEDMAAADARSLLVQMLLSSSRVLKRSCF